MRYRRLTSDGDYSFGSGQADFWRDVPEAVAQAVQTRLLLWTGEWFLDVDEGTPYPITVLGKHSKAEADTTIQERVNNTEGMLNIELYESELDADIRKLTVDMTINTIFGPTELQRQNYGNF